MKRAAVLLAPGFEEGEAIVTIDILRRLNIAVETLACADTRAVVSYHAIPLVATRASPNALRTPTTRWCCRAVRRAA